MKLWLAVPATVAVAVGVLALAACSPAAVPKIFRGESRGVALALTVSPVNNVSILTVHFSAGAEAIRQRALRTKHLGAFCVWPLGNGGGMNISDIRLDPRQRTQKFTGFGAFGSSGGYTCGLSAHRNPTADSWLGTKYIRHAIVAVRLTRSHG